MTTQYNGKTVHTSLKAAKLKTASTETKSLHSSKQIINLKE